MNKLDITGEVCPMTFVKTKVALHGLSKGEVLEVLLHSGEPLKNVPRSCEGEGCKILSIEQMSGDVHKILIEKG
jgi:tRNA 2-thiouridine synthesizing protein A